MAGLGRGWRATTDYTHNQDAADRWWYGAVLRRITATGSTGARTRKTPRQRVATLRGDDLMKGRYPHASTRPPPTSRGAPVTAPDFGPRFIRVEAEHVAEVGASAAILFGHIAWRASTDGHWRASRALMGQETGLSPDSIRAAVKTLRDREWVTAERSSSNDPTLIWTPIYAGQTVIGNLPTGVGGISPQGGGNFPITSIETKVVPPSCPPSDETLVDVPAPDPKPKKRATRLPAGFRPTDAHWALARELGVDLAHEGPQFVDHHTAKGSTFKDWDAALRTWIRNAAKFAAERGGGPGNVHPIRPTVVENGVPPSWSQTPSYDRRDPFARGVL